MLSCLGSVGITPPALSPLLAPGTPDLDGSLAGSCSMLSISPVSVNPELPSITTAAADLLRAKVQEVVKSYSA